jgi:hypothetical protein
MCPDLVVRGGIVRVLNRLVRDRQSP